MKIIVVKTCDGDIYYSYHRSASKDAAVRMAVDQVLNNDLSRYSSEDRVAIRKARQTGIFTNQWDELWRIGAIRVAVVS